MPPFALYFATSSLLFFVRQCDLPVGVSAAAAAARRAGGGAVVEAGSTPGSPALGSGALVSTSSLNTSAALVTVVDEPLSDSDLRALRTYQLALFAISSRSYSADVIIAPTDNAFMSSLVYVCYLALAYFLQRL
jgi:hypothetical protein